MGAAEKARLTRRINELRAMAEKIRLNKMLWSTDDQSAEDLKRNHRFLQNIMTTIHTLENKRSRL